MPVVNIPEVGRVRFPDSMSQDDISQAASDLYDEKTMVAEREALRIEESEEATKKFDVPKTDAEKVARFQELVPHGTVRLNIPPTKIVGPIDPAEDTYEAQLKQAGITEKQATEAQKSADLMQEKFFPKPVESTESGVVARSGAAIARGTAQMSESLNRTLGAALDWVSDSPVFAVFRGPATGGALAASEEAGAYLTDTANRVRETVKDLSLVEQSIPTGAVGKAAADIAGGAVSLLPSVATAPVPGLPILMAGMQTYGSVLGDAEEGYRRMNLPEDQVREKSRQVASMNGLATSLLTFGFNRFGPGIEKWTEGLSNVTGRNAVKSLANNFGFEFTEEGVDQFVQGVTARHSYDPSKSWESIVKESLTAAAAGGVLAFGLKGAAIADQNLNLVLDMQKEGKQFADLSSAVAKETALLSSLPPQNIDTLLVKDDVADKAAVAGATSTAEAVKESGEIVKDTKVTEAVKAATSDVIPGAVEPDKKGGVTDEEKQRQEKGLQVAVPEAGAVAEAAAVPAAVPVSATPAADTLKKPTIGEVIGTALTELKPQDVSKYVSTKTKLGGWTGLMWDIGSQAKTPEDVQALRQAAEEASVKTRALLDAAKQPGLTDDQMMAGLTAASAEAAKQPAEAYEFATGVKLDGTPKWEMLEKRIPGYVPPVPDAKYLEAKGIKAEPVKTAKANFKEGDKVAFQGTMGIVRGTVEKTESGELKVRSSKNPSDLYPLHENWLQSDQLQEPSVSGASPYNMDELKSLVENPEHIEQKFLDSGLDLIKRLRKQIANRGINPDLAEANSQEETSAIQSITGSLTRLGRQQKSINKGYKRAKTETRDSALKQLEDAFNKAEELLAKPVASPVAEKTAEPVAEPAPVGFINSDRMESRAKLEPDLKPEEAHVLQLVEDLVYGYYHSKASPYSEGSGRGLILTPVLISDRNLAFIPGIDAAARKAVASPSGFISQSRMDRLYKSKVKTALENLVKKGKLVKVTGLSTSGKGEAVNYFPTEARETEIKSKAIEDYEEIIAEGKKQKLPKKEPAEPVPAKAEDKPVAEKAKQEGLTIQSGGIVMPLVPRADPESRFASLFVPISASESASAAEKLVVSFTNKVKSQLSSELSGLEASPDNAKKVVLRGQEITKEISEKIKSNFKKQAHKLLDSKTAQFKSLGISDQEIDGWRKMIDSFSGMIGDAFRGVYQPIMDETSSRASVASARLHLNMMESLLSAVGKGNAKAEMLSIIKDIYGFDPEKESPSVSAAKPALGAGAATTPDKTGAIESPIAPKPKVSKKKPARRAVVDDESAIEEVAKEQEKKQKPLESRVGSRKEKPDVFTMEDEDLEAYLDAQFGETGATGKGLQAGRTGTFTFPSYGAFRDWMDARYAERDIDGMRLAFAEAPVENKKLYIKENKTATDHKKAWILNLATGAALPTDSPPVPRTTPRPGPAGTSTGPAPAGTSGGGAYTPPPPPAPRSPTGRVKFDTMALTQLLRQFDKYPRINSRLIKAYGRYLPGVGEVELKERLMWDTELANRVLAHEAGHFVDLFLTPQGKKLPFAERLSPLRAFRYYLHKKKAWRDQAKSLSRAWRGPFVNGDPYRDTANELFADFMSAMFNDPEWVNQTFPELHDAFVELLAGKPEFRAAYEEMTRWLEGGTMVSEWRQQQEEAAKRTIDDLMKETPKHKESVKDWLKGALVSVWYRAYDKEGRPKDIGNRLSDELEYSSLWAAKENALFVDDFNKRVQPEIEKIDPDVVKARTLLHQYAQARRTIGERRAAGVWIEMNPAEARALLQHILNIDPALRSKFLGPLNTVTNAGLYDLASSIFREIHDRGDSFVRRITREIDNLNLGVGGEAALMAFNVRGKLLNPGGLTVERAQEVINELQAELSPDQFRALQTAADNLSELFFEVQEKAYNEGLISQKNWDEIIAPNKDNYLPYAVLDYWDGRVGGGIKSQKGTAKDIADITLATQLKTSTLNAWRQRQRQVQLLMDIYTKGGTPVTVGERLRKPQDLANIRNQNKGDDVSRFVLWQDGQPHLVEFPIDPGKTFEKAADSGAFYDHMEWLSNAGKVAHGVMQLYTTFSLPFMVYRNPIRGARTAANRIGIYRTGKEVVKEWAGLSKAIAAGLDLSATDSDAFKELGLSARMAINYANAAFGGEMMPEVRDLVDRQILLPPRLSGLMVADADNLRSMIENGGILAQQVSALKQSGGKWPFWNRFKPARSTLVFTEKVFSIYEAFEKIYNFQAAMEKGLGDDKSAALTRRAGIPKPGVRGHFSMPMEVFFPWTRVMLQGLRAALDIIKDPDLRAGYATRYSITELLPRLAKIAIGAGVMAGAIKWLMRDDEDEKDPVMAEVMRRINPYKMALDDIIPLMFYDPRTGKYHYFNEFKSGSEVPANYEVVSWRIPSSEEGRTFGPLLYNLVSNSPGVNDKMGRPGENPITAFGGWVQNEMLPGISPAIQTTENLYQMIFRGKNPDDPFRGQPSANKTLFDAGGTDRAQAIAGYALNQAGWPGEVAALMAMNFGILDDRASSALKQRLSSDKQSLPERIPLAKNVLSYDNYAQYRDEGTARIAETELRAKARMAMSPEVREIYDFYWKNYERQDKLDISDKRRFVIAKDFHTTWGRLKDRGSLFSKTAHAISDEGSNMSRETIRRDIDSAALPYVARWNFVKQTDSE